MSKEIDPLDFANDVLDQEERDAAIRELDPASKLTFFPAWCRHQDGRIIRPLVWHRPSASAWAALADQQQAPYRDGSFYNKVDTDGSRKVSSTIESASINAPSNRRDGAKSSSTQRDGFDFEVTTI